MASMQLLHGMISAALMTMYVVKPSLQVSAKEKFIPVPSFDGYVIQSDSRIASFVSSPPNRAECITACARDLRCVSVFYHSQEGRCQLQEGRFLQPQGGVVQTGWQYWVLGTDSGCPGNLGYIYRRDVNLCFSPRMDTLMKLGQARVFCRNEGGHLLVVDTQEKQDAVAKYLRLLPPSGESHSGRKGFYLDARRLSTCPLWEWPSRNKTVTFSAWEGSEGDDCLKIAMIMSVDSDFKWSTESNFNRPFICEMDVAPVC